ncbi:protein PRRC2C isoform X4 [Rhinatrema bivittatum]|uniref:protein PRRC2C isoform X4 n=1 Tax=Rhinatrema bivittatum TaxID=194408 RepID=UPI00112B8D88|nr:protein PRRC2C isoform X4 [Rhinatrema bivittatum]
MSEKSGQSTKAKDGKKYATLSLFNTYKGKSLETQKTAVAARHGLQSLGKVASSRRMPPPANLPSLKAENKGNDPNVSLVPKDGSGWASKPEQPEEEKVTEVVEVQPKPVVPAPQEAAPTVAKSWASNKPGGQGDGIQLNSYFHQEFPSLQAAGDQEKPGKDKDATDEPYGPGPSLRPQNVASWREGGGKNLGTGTSPSEENPSTPENVNGTSTTAGSEEQNKVPEKREAWLPVGPPQQPPPKVNGQQQPLPGVTAQHRALMPPFVNNMFHPYPRVPFPPMPNRYPTPAEASKMPRGRHAPQPQSWATEGVERPSIISASELKELDNLDTEADEGWAGAQMEVDYTEQLNFSDDEDQSGSKEKGESWDEKIAKTERMRTRTSESSEAHKEMDERLISKRSDVSSTPSSQPASMKAPHSKPSQPETQHPPPSRPAGYGKQIPFSPKPDEDEIWKQRRRQQSEVSAAVERARKRREEEERRMEEQRKAACAEKLKRLNEKFSRVEKPPPEPVKQKEEEISEPVEPVEPEKEPEEVSPEEPERSSSPPTVTKEETQLEAKDEAEDKPVFSRQDSNCSEQESSPSVVTEEVRVPSPTEVPASVAAPPLAHENEPDSGTQPRPTVSSGYHKHFQKSLPPRFQRQEQMKQQQWQQQQGVVPQPAQSQPSSSPVPPPQHRPLYQPLGPHPQHLASMGFDPRWLMMQPYMDPRMMSGRPAMDMPPMHPGMLPPKQLLRRDQMEGSAVGAESFEHVSRPLREHSVPRSEPRVVWGSDPYPHAEHPPKLSEEPEDLRPEATVEQEDPPAAYPLEHQQLETLPKADFTEQQETEVQRAQSQTPEELQVLTVEEHSPATLPAATSFEVEKSRAHNIQEELVTFIESQPTLKINIGHGSNHSLKSEESRTEPPPCVPKVSSRLPENAKEPTERPEEKPKKESFINLKSSDGPKIEKPFKSKSETRWGPRPGYSRREEGSDRPVRRSGPIKKPVLRDMKEERELRKEKEEEKLAHEKPIKSEKVEKKELPLQSPTKPEPEKPPVESSSVVKKVSLITPAAGDKADIVPEPAVKHVGQPVVTPHVPKEEKPEKVVSKDHTTEKLRPDARPLPPRRENALPPPRSYRKEARDRDWFPDQGYRGRGRGEYYSRGRSYRGSYGGRGRGGRGHPRDYPHYRDSKPRLEHMPPGPLRQREESETRSESSDFEIVPKRRRQRGSETDSDSEGRESASDTPHSDKDSVIKGKHLREARTDTKKAPKPLLSFKAEVSSKPDNRPSERHFIREDETKTRPGFLPKGEPSRRGRGGMFRRGGREPSGRPPRPSPFRRPGYRDNQWIPRPLDQRLLEPPRSEEGEQRRPEHIGTPLGDKRPPLKFERKFDPARERPRRQRPARPPRQDKPPRFRRLKEREAATKVNEVTSGSPVSVTVSSTVQESAVTALEVSGTKTPDLSNQNSSDQANEEWETASESSDFNERRERDERKTVATTVQTTSTAKTIESTAVLKREIAKRSFSSQRPGVDRQNRRGNSGVPKPGRNFSGPRGERRSGASSQRGKRGPFEDQTAGMSGIDPTSSNIIHHHHLHQPQQYMEETGGSFTAQKSSREASGKKKEEPKAVPKKPKEKVDAISQFDLNNYASVVIIDDHPEVTTTEDTQSNLNDDGFTEVVSKKQQKRLQDEERRKKEEQSVQGWNKKGSSEKGRGQNSKLPPRFAKKQQQQQAAAQQAQAQIPSQPSAQTPSQPQPQPQPQPVPTAVTSSSTEYSGTSKALQTPPPQSSLGTELWENKMAPPAVLSDISKKLGPISPPPVSAWNKPLSAFGSVTTEGAKTGQESRLELGIESIQFGAPACSGSENEVIPVISEKPSEKLPEPKEQRQKQPRAGPIKAQKLPDLSPVENKEHKPGPIGKERSLKNRKVKDVQPAEPEGQNKPNSAAVRSPDPVVMKESKAVTEIGAMIAVPAPEFGASPKESVTDYTAPSNSLPSTVATGTAKMEETLVSNVSPPHTLPLPRRETLQQSSSLTPASPATVDLTLKMESARKAWENSPNVTDKSSPVTSTASPITITSSGTSGSVASSSGSTTSGPNGSSYGSFSSASMPVIPVASVTPTTSLSGGGTYTTSSLSTKTTSTSDPPNICKVKPQQLQTSSMASTSHFSQLSCMPSLMTQQQQSPQVYVSQAAAGPAAQIPAFYMDTSHLFSAQHARLAPPSLAQQQGFQPGLSQQFPIPIYAPLQSQHQAQLSLGAGPSASQAQEMFPPSLQPYRSQQAFMQSSLSQPSPMVLSGTALHNFPTVQHQELAKAQSSLAFQQTSSTQTIPILYEHQLSQSSLGGSQLIDTHLLQARQSLGQPSNLYSGQVQQPGQTNFYNTAQSPSALQQVTVPLQGSQLSLPNFGSTAGQPLIALPQSLQPSLQPTPQPQHQNLARTAPVNQPFRGLIPTATQHSIIAGKMTEMDLKPYGSSMDHVKPGTPPIAGRSTTPTSSPFRASSTSPNSQTSKLNSIVYQKHQFATAAAGVRMAQPFPAQFPPQILSQPNLVPPLVRAPHTNTFPASVQRPPMALTSQMPPQMPAGLMNHPRLHHMARGPPGPPSGARVNQGNAAMKAEQDMKAKQRAEVLQSTQRFFSEQQQQQQHKPPKLDGNAASSPETVTDTPIVMQDNVQEIPTPPPPPPTPAAKPIRTGPIKPQSIKTEETKS